MRCNDGVHFTRSGGIFVGLRLAPELAALGQAHASAVAGWRLGGASATIDPVMVREPALPVVRRATTDDVDAMAAQLARTFWDDPVAMLHLPEGAAPRGRPARLLPHPDAGRLPPLRGLLHGRGLQRARPSGPRAGKPLLTGLAGILTMLPVLPYVAANLRTTLRLLNLIEAMHPHEPHWYLATLGTAVEQQGKGIGGALMRPVLAHCDAEGMPCYLESSKERNVPFYRRHGFEVVEGGAAAPRRAAALDHVAGAEPSRGLSHLGLDRPLLPPVVPAARA